MLRKKGGDGRRSGSQKEKFHPDHRDRHTGGNLVYFERIDNPMIASLDTAMKKAPSANPFKRPIKAFEDGLVGGRMAILGFPGEVPIESGVPWIVERKAVGAIGVSGGTSAQDGQVAIAGVAALQTR